VVPDINKSDFVNSPRIITSRSVVPDINKSGPYPFWLKTFLCEVSSAGTDTVSCLVETIAVSFFLCCSVSLAGD